MYNPESRNIWHLFIAVTGISAMGWYVNFIAPATWHLRTGFVALLWMTSYFLFLFLLNNRRRSLYLSTLIGGIIFLRLLGLRDITYSMLLALTLTLIYAYITRK